MTISYKKLWELLIDKDMKKSDLIIISGISGYTLNKLVNGKTVTSETLMKICVALDCSFDDIMEIVKQYLIVFENLQIENIAQIRG